MLAAQKKRRDDALSRYEAAETRRNQNEALVKAKSQEVAMLQERVSLMRRLVATTQQLAQTREKQRQAEQKHVSMALLLACTELRVT